MQLEELKQVIREHRPLLDAGLGRMPLTRAMKELVRRTGVIEPPGDTPMSDVCQLIADAIRKPAP